MGRLLPNVFGLVPEREERPVALADAGFELLDRRPDVAKLGIGTVQDRKMAKGAVKRREKESRKLAANRAQNITYLTPRLTTIRAGGEEAALAWAARIYLGVFYDNENVSGATERLVTLTNEEIAEALVEGFIRYVEHADDADIKKRCSIAGANVIFFPRTRY